MKGADRIKLMEYRRTLGRFVWQIPLAAALSLALAFGIGIALPVIHSNDGEVYFRRVTPFAAEGIESYAANGYRIVVENGKVALTDQHIQMAPNDYREPPFLLTLFSELASDGTTASHWEILVGWPFPCLGCEAKHGMRAARAVYLPGGRWPPGSITSDIRGSKVTMTISGMGGAVPIGVIWTGLAGNTIAYILVFAVVRTATRGVVRWRRRRAGACANCGYALDGIPSESVCPECGGRRG